MSRILTTWTKVGNKIPAVFYSRIELKADVITIDDSLHRLKAAPWKRIKAPSGRAGLRVG
jgi:hypothetical protein